MVDEPSLPVGVCQRCSDEALTAGKFRRMCLDGTKLWNRAIDNIDSLTESTNQNIKSCYVILGTLEDKPLLATNYHSSPLKHVIRSIRRLERVKKLKDRFKLPCRCTFCGMRFSMPYYLSLHLKNTTKNACRVCGKVLDKKDLRYHLAKVHKKYILQCKHCLDLFDNEEEMMEHTRLELNSEHLCAVCGHGFANERALRAHSYAHTLFHCPKCMRSFENRRCHRYHLTKCKEKATEHNFKNYECDYCGHVYTKKPSLKIHIIQKHLNVLPYSCKTCGKRTSTLAHLRSHESTHIERRKMYHCTICSAQMKSQLGFALHQRIHTGEKPFECMKCGDRFLSASRRLDHMKRRHGNVNDLPHKCVHCTARFVRPSELRKHIANLHPESTSPPERLDQTDGGVESVDDLPQRYEHCPAQFVRPSEFKKHITNLPAF